MAVSGGRRNGVLGGDEEDAARFEEEGVEFVEEDDIDHSDIPLHFRPLVAAAESGDLNALRQASTPSVKPLARSATANAFMDSDNFDGSIDEPVEDGDTVLHLTCLYGHLSCAQFLLERGANLEAKDDDGAIPLHDACAGGYTQVVQFLLNGVNDPEHVKRMLETFDVEGDTPLHHAARGEYDDVIRLLVAHGASPTATNIYGKTPSELTDPGTEARRILEEASSAVSAHS